MNVKTIFFPIRTKVTFQIWKKKNCWIPVYWTSPIFWSGHLHIFTWERSPAHQDFCLKMCSVMVAWAEPALFHALRPGLSNHARNASSLLLYELWLFLNLSSLCHLHIKTMVSFDTAAKNAKQSTHFITS